MTQTGVLDDDAAAASPAGAAGGGQAAAAAAAAGGSGSDDGRGGRADATSAAATAAQRLIAAHTPRLCWDLSLYPPSLHAAYWQERAGKLAQWDLQVNLFLMSMMFTMIFKFAEEGATWYLASFGPAWVMCLAWLAAMQHAAFYQRHRLAIVTAVRASMGLTAMFATDGVREQLHRSLMFPSAVLTVVFKMFLFCNTGQIPVESVRLQLPMAHQVAATSVKALCLMMGEFTPAFVAFCNTPRYASALRATTRWWCALVASGAPVTIPRSPRLAGRSSDAMEALAILYTTDVALVLYMCYMSLWCDIRAWLAGKTAEAAVAAAVAASAAASQEAAAGGAPGEPSGVIVLAGVVVSGDQLTDMAASPAAGVMLAPTGWGGRLSQLCLHAAAVNLLCLASVLAAQAAVLWLLPSLLPPGDALLDRYYPLLTSQAERACSSHQPYC